jgi:hypothetical protein
MISIPWIVMLVIVVESLVVNIFVLNIVHYLTYSGWLVR